jgi:hypothetical protein
MPGVLRELAEHRIDVNESSKLVKQRSRRFSPDKKAVIKKEIVKLMVAEFKREILHPDWLAKYWYKLNAHKKYKYPQAHR